jgi:hypothetical protein
MGMEILSTNCAGLDIHKKTVKVWIMTHTSNGQLGDLLSDIMGKASRMILQAQADGETDPGCLAALAVGGNLL